jgi:hypothetical protein
MARRRKRGYKLPPGKFVAIPIDMLKQVAGELSAPELRCWIALCAQSQPWSNGTAKLCRSVIKEFHLGSQRVVTAATKKLLDAGRIVQTRKAVQRKCALFGVKHLPLNYDAMAKEGVGEPISSATNRGSANSATNEEALNDEIDNRGSANSGKQPLALPKSRGYAPNSTPLALPQGNTSKSLPLRAADSSAASSPNPAPADLPKSGAPKIEKLMRLDRNLTDDQIAHISSEPIELVREVRASLEHRR